MKRLMILSLATALGGCVVAPPAPPQRLAAIDPYQWHVVSVDNVQRPAGSPSHSGTTIEPLPASAPVYALAPVTTPVLPYYYAPAPYYTYPPVSIGLDFVFGFGHGWGRGHYRRR
jgi:hypothetical protein